MGGGVGAVKFAEVMKAVTPAPSLSGYLPYLRHSDEDGLFDLTGGRVGIAYELSPIPSEALDEQTLLKQAGDLERSLLSLPTEYSYQFLVWASGDGEDRMKPYEERSPGANGGPWSVLVKSKLDRMRDGRRGLTSDGRFRMRRIRVFFTMTSQGGGNRDVQAGAVLAAARDIEAGFEQVLGKKGRAWRVADLATVASIPFWALNPGLASEMPFREAGGFYANGRPLRDRLVQGEVSVEGDHLTSWGMNVYALTLMDLPGSVKPRMLNRLLEHYMGEVLITVNFRMLSGPESRGSIRAISWIAQRRAQPGKMGTIKHAARILADELNQVNEEIEKHNRKIVQFGITAVVAARPEEADEVKGRLLKGFGEMGAEAWVEDAITFPAIMGALPFGFEAKDDGVIRRLRRVLSDRFVCFAPLWGYLDSTRSATLLYVNRMGEPITLDPFDCDTSQHGAIIATSGAGKSFFVNEKLMQVLRLDPTPYVFIIDVGGSYDLLTELVDGDYVRIQSEHPTLINPFAGNLEGAEEGKAGGREEEEEGGNIHSWTALLAKMAGVNVLNEQEAIRDENILELGLRKAFRGRGDRSKEIVLSDIVKVLESEGTDGKLMAERLGHYTRGHRYGDFFDGQGELKLKKKFVVFDLTELQDMPRLSGVMLLVVTNYIMGLVRRADLRAVRKYVMIDEAWRFLKDPNAAGFIMEAYKTFRKYAASCWIITQSVSDIVVLGPTGQAILDNVSNGILMKQNPQSLPIVGEKLQLHPAELEQVKTVTTVSGQYSEAFYFTTFEGKRKTGVLRLVASPVVYWAATSKSEEKALILKTKAERGGDAAATLAYLAERYPNGLG